MALTIKTDALNENGKQETATNYSALSAGARSPVSISEFLTSGSGSTSESEQTSSDEKTTSRTKTGRWSLDEKLMFLYGLSLFGKGRWKKIHSYVPER